MGVGAVDSDNQQKKKMTLKEWISDSLKEGPVGIIRVLILFGIVGVIGIWLISLFIVLPTQMIDEISKIAGTGNADPLAYLPYVLAIICAVFVGILMFISIYFRKKYENKIMGTTALYKETLAKITFKIGNLWFLLVICFSTFFAMLISKNGRKLLSSLNLDLFWIVLSIFLMIGFGFVMGVIAYYSARYFLELRKNRGIFEPLHPISVVLEIFRMGATLFGSIITVFLIGFFLIQMIF